MKRFMRRGPRPCCDENGEEGSVIILAAVALMGLVVFLGLVLDYGHSAQQHRLAQNAADGAALAGAYDIYAGHTEAAATTLAQSVVTKHGLPSGNLTITFLDSSGNVTATEANVEKVRAVVTDTTPTILLGMVGIQNTTVSGTAAASERTTPPPCAICVLSPHGSQAFHQQGAGVTVVNGGNVVVDSDASDAAYLQGPTSVYADYVGIHGGYTTQGPGAFHPNPTLGIAPVPDPLANVPVPTCSSGNPANVGDFSGTGTIHPGTYNSISVSGGGTLTLAPGVYCLTGGAFGGGNGSFVGSGVMLYFTCGTWTSPTACTSGQTGASLQLTGTPTYNITAPTSGPYKGIAFFYDRNNAGAFGLKGNAADTVVGTIYVKSGQVDLIGNAGMDRLDSLIVCDTFYGQGSVGITDNYNASNNYQPPAPPTLSE